MASPCNLAKVSTNLARFQRNCAARADRERVMPKMSRRAFLLLAAGAGVAAAAERGGKSVDKLIPYVVPPEDIRPGTGQSMPPPAASVPPAAACTCA